MAAATNLSESVLPGERVVRFDGATRVVHWSTAVLGLVLAVTGACLYFGPLSALVGRRTLLRTVHVYAGLAVLVPVVVGVLGRWRTGLWRDLVRLGRWHAYDWDWIRHRGRATRTDIGKFNGGQKLNAVFIGAALPCMLLTGAIMKWFEPFPLAWRTGATFVHDWLALGLFASFTGHIVKAVGDRTALRSMLSGWVPSVVARRRWPRWIDEVDRPREG